MMSIVDILDSMYFWNVDKRFKRDEMRGLHCAKFKSGN